MSITNAGGGSSMWRDVAITRLRDDSTSDAGAHYIYVRDPWSSRVWSATYQPVCQEPDQFDAIFDLDKVTFRRRDTEIETQLEITVSSEDDVEVRRLTLTNHSAQTREIEVTSYAEIVLARPEDDLAHPAFGKLFIETEFDAQSAGLLFNRRPRASDESPMVGFHVLGVDGPRLGGAVEWETDRARFIGRGRSAVNPDCPGRPGALGHDRRGPRSDRCTSRADPTCPGRRHPCRVCHGRCAGSCRRVDAGAKVS